MRLLDFPVPTQLSAPDPMDSTAYQQSPLPQSDENVTPLNQKQLTGSGKVSSRFSRWLMPLVYPLGRFVVLPFYFGKIRVTGQEHLPQTGPVILAPTHRSRWDAVMVPYAAGHHVTGRHLRFMVSADEVKGLQGWLIRRLGGFPINTRRPGIASLRHGVDLLLQGESLVLFPEGGIFRDRDLHPLKPGLARLALQAEMSKPGLGVQIVPISISYSQPVPRWGCQVNVAIGPALSAQEYCQEPLKENAQRLTADLKQALSQLVY